MTADAAPGTADRIADRIAKARDARRDRVLNLRRATDDLHTGSAPLDMLTSLRYLQATVAVTIDRTARELVDLGCTYPEIAAALGISRQAARARFPRR